MKIQQSVKVKLHVSEIFNGFFECTWNYSEKKKYFQSVRILLVTSQLSSFIRMMKRFFFFSCLSKP